MERPNQKIKEQDARLAFLTKKSRKWMGVEEFFLHRFSFLVPCEGLLNLVHLFFAAILINTRNCFEKLRRSIKTETSTKTGASIPRTWISSGIDPSRSTGRYVL